MTKGVFLAPTRLGRLALLVVIAWALCGFSTAWAGSLITVELPAVEDSTLRQNAPAGNFGRSGILAVRSYKPGHPGHHNHEDADHHKGKKDDDDDDHDGDDDGYGNKAPRPKNWRSVVRFDLSQLPPNSVVESATLELFMKKAPKKSRTYGVHRLTANWSERFVSWLNRGEEIAWGDAGSDFVETPTAYVNTGTKSKVTLSWDVTADVRAWLAGMGNFGLLVKDAAENASKNYTAHFISRNHEHGYYSNKIPRLLVMIRPVFEVSGLGALAGDGSVALHWTNPNPPFPNPSSFFDGVLVIRRVGGAPEPVLVDGTPYPTGTSFPDGSEVIDNRIGTLGAFETLADSAVTNGTTYFYRVVTFTPFLNYSKGVVTNATPVEPGPGGTLWSFSLPTPSLPPSAPPALPPIPVSTFADGLFFVDSFTGNNVYGITTSTGSTLWQPATPPQPVARTAINWAPVSDTGLAVSRVVVGDSSGRVTALDALTGQPVWTIAAPGVQNVVATPVTQMLEFSDETFNAAHGSDLVFIASANLSSRTNTIAALRLTDGSVAWQFTGSASLPLDQVLGVPFIDYRLNRLYVTSLAGPAGTQTSFWILSTLDGSVVARFALGSVSSSVGIGFDFDTLAPETLYVANDSGQLFALSADPLALKWTGAANLGSPVVSFVWEDFFTPGRLYFSTRDGFVWALDDPGPGAPPDPSAPVWKTPLSGASGPLLFDTVLYVGGGDGKVHQVRLADGVDEAQASVASPGEALSDPAYSISGDIILIGIAGGRVAAVSIPF